MLALFFLGTKWCSGSALCTTLHFFSYTLCLVSEKMVERESKKGFGSTKWRKKKNKVTTQFLRTKWDTKVQFMLKKKKNSILYVNCRSCSRSYLLTIEDILSYLVFGVFLGLWKMNFLSRTGDLEKGFRYFNILCSSGRLPSLSG